MCNLLPELQEGFLSSMPQLQGTGRGMMWSRSPRHALLRQPQTSYCGHPAPRSVAGRPGWRSRDVSTAPSCLAVGLQVGTGLCLEPLREPGSAQLLVPHLLRPQYG
jgi:hypothetical protein